MADNIAGRDGNGNPYVVAARDDGVALHQRVQPTWGGTDADEYTPLPTQDMVSGRRHPPRALQYARDASDRMRVLVDAGLPTSSSVIGYVAGKLFDQAGNYQGWYNTNVAFSMDQREVYEQQTRLEFQQKRAGWVFS